MTRFVPIFALLWGGFWALCLQYTKWGKWLAIHRTWITVVVGVGVDLVLLAFVLPRQVWGRVVAVIAWSSIGVIARSLYNEFADDTHDI